MLLWRRTCVLLRCGVRFQERKLPQPERFSLVTQHRKKFWELPEPLKRECPVYSCVCSAGLRRRRSKPDTVRVISAAIVVKSGL